MIPAPSSGVKMHQKSITEVWKKTFDTREVTVNTSRQPIVMGTIKNKTGSKFGKGGVEPINNIRKLIDKLKKTEEEDKNTDKTPQPTLHPPPPSQPSPTTPNIKTTPKHITTTIPYLTPHPNPSVITTPVRSKKQLDRRDTPGSKKKKKLVDKKTAKKTKLEDIRKFWKKKDEEEESIRSGQDEVSRKISQAKTMTKSKTIEDIKKPGNRTIYSEKKVLPTFFNSANNWSCSWSCSESVKVGIRTKLAGNFGLEL